MKDNIDKGKTLKMNKEKFNAFLKEIPAAGYSISDTFHGSREGLKNIIRIDDEIKNSKTLSK